MTTTNWTEAFQPVLDRGSQEREGQTLLGQKMLDTLHNGGVLFGQAGTGVGKSFATLVPAILGAKEKGLRTIVSTETITLQNQLYNKDLPFLKTVYGGFTYAKLLGRSNYLCLNRLHSRSAADPTLSSMFTKLEGRASSIEHGTKDEIEDILGHTLDPEEWKEFCSESEFCSTMKCDSTSCWCARAREKALDSNIVVVNHALLASHQMSKRYSESGMLGEYDFLVVDEAHALETVLLSQYTEHINYYEVSKAFEKLGKSVQFALKMLDELRIQPPDDSVVNTETLMNQFERCLSIIIEFFSKYRGEDFWDNLSEPLCPKNVSSYDPALSVAMDDFENEVPSLIDFIISNLVPYHKLLSLATKNYSSDRNSKGDLRKVSVGATNLKKLWVWMNSIKLSMQTTNGIISNNGDKGVNVYGYYSYRGDEKRIRIGMEPLDISMQARDILSCPSVALISATIADPTDGNSFRYLTQSLGLYGRDVDTISVDSPFDKKLNQLIYLHSDTYENYPHTNFSHDEIMDLIKSSDGRSLILFTSTKEMREFHENLVIEKRKSNLTFNILMQSNDVDKQKLVDQFKKDERSVLLGSNSFMTGLDVPGKSLQNLILAKYPNPRLSTLTRQRMDFWKERGFPQWYTRESLMTFFQAAGRLLRSHDCRGVVAITDSRINKPKTGVAKAVKLAVESMGSPTTHDIEEVNKFFA